MEFFLFGHEFKTQTKFRKYMNIQTEHQEFIQESTLSARAWMEVQVAASVLSFNQGTKQLFSLQGMLKVYASTFGLGLLIDFFFLRR